MSEQNDILKNTDWSKAAVSMPFVSERVYEWVTTQAKALSAQLDMADISSKLQNTLTGSPAEALAQAVQGSGLKVTQNAIS